MVPELLIYLTVPAVTYVVLLIMRELKIFRMAVVIVLAAIMALCERLNRMYNEAAKEIE
jgi:hypothetical protein